MILRNHSYNAARFKDEKKLIESQSGGSISAMQKQYLQEVVLFMVLLILKTIKLVIVK